jgi:hypothetical protein
LAELTSIILERPGALSAQEAELLLTSLVPWQRSTILPLKQAVNSEFGELERPDLQARVGRLAAALGSWFGSMTPEATESAGVSLWRNVCKSSPLPEVRRAFDRDAKPAETD